MQRVPALGSPACRCSLTGRKASRPMIATCSARCRKYRACTWRRASIRSVSSRPAARARSWRTGSSTVIRPLTCGTSTSAAARRSSATSATCVIARSRRWGCSMRCTGHSGRPRPHAVYASPLCMTDWRPPAHASVRWRALSAPTGSGLPVRAALCVQLRSAELVRALGRRAPGGARASRALRPVFVRQVHAQGPRRDGGTWTHLRQRHRRADRQGRVHTVAQRARRHRGGPDGYA